MHQADHAYSIWTPGGVITDPVKLTSDRASSSICFNLAVADKELFADDLYIAKSLLPMDTCLVYMS